MLGGLSSHMLMWSSAYRQQNGRTNRRGSRKGKARREVPQVQTEMAAQKQRMQKMQKEIMKQPPRVRVRHWMVASL